MIASQADTSPFTRTLVVEDSFLLGLQMKADLEQLGMEVLGPVPNVQAAIDMIDQNPVDAAILDINLGNETSFPVAHALQERGIPFVFITGYDDMILDDKLLEGHALFRKPIRMDTLCEAVRRFG
tara:strand:- start:14583 stop:14957 length:375 start_codon:yes stop_codon:yes gene_type:complete